MSIDLKSTPTSSHASPSKTDVLGKNRASPPYTPKNREYIRVSTASMLMASHWKATGENLKGSSVLGCGRWRNYGADPNIAEIEVPQDGRAPRMMGHFQCKSAWSCEHCAKVRVAQTRSWIRAALIPAMDLKGLAGGLLTFTLAHTYSEDWGQVVERLFKAYTLFDRRMSKWYKKLGCYGKLKSLEAPIGINGLHAHLHVLMTYAKDADLSGLVKAMTDAWAKAVEEVGGQCNEHGFDFKPNCVNDYVAKLETSHEMASHGTKTARSKGKLTSQLLDRAAVGDKKAMAEWLRAMGALGGRMRFHAGNLPKKLGIVCPSEWEDPELPDELDEINEVVDKPEPIILSYPQRFHLKATGETSKRAGLAIILRAARKGDINVLRKTVDALCAEVDRKENPAKMSFMDWTDDHFEKLISEASSRPLEPEEVEAYLFGKSKLKPVDCIYE